MDFLHAIITRLCSMRAAQTALHVQVSSYVGRGAGTATCREEAAPDTGVLMRGQRALSMQRYVQAFYVPIDGAISQGNLLPCAEGL